MAMEMQQLLLHDAHDFRLSCKGFPERSYKVEFEDATRPKGKIDLEILRVRNVRPVYTYHDLVRSFLDAKILRKDERIAYISGFYPNGNPDEEGKKKVKELARNGIGRKVMGALLRDLSENQVKLTALNATHGSGRFYEKMGFDNFTTNLWYKFL